jgi:hypothetical protein
MALSILCCQLPVAIWPPFGRHSPKLSATFVKVSTSRRAHAITLYLEDLIGIPLRPVCSCVGGVLQYVAGELGNEYCLVVAEN